MKILLIAAIFLATSAQAAFRCKDERGVTHYGDTPPPGCAKSVMYEITRSGTVLREIPPTPTADELKARNEEAARQKEEQRQADEQRRKDYALLATYSSEKDIDTSRDLNLQPILTRIKSTQSRVAAVEERLKALESEREFYAAGKAKGSDKVRELPPQLKADIERAQQEKASLVKALANYDREIQEVRERFEVDKSRWLELKRQQSLPRAERR